MRRRNFLLLGGLAGLTACLGTGCLSPTLPVPPPDAPEHISLGADGMFELRGSCTPGALVLVKNLDNGTISGVEDRDANGRYFLRLAAEICSRAEIWEVIDDDVSGRTFFVLEPKIAGEPSGDCDLPG
jgi:hypothetical protein